MLPRSGCALDRLLPSKKNTISKRDWGVAGFVLLTRAASATQEPVRRDIHVNGGASEASSDKEVASTIPKPALELSSQEDTGSEPLIEELNEQHYTIHYGATGYRYESIFAPYLAGATFIEIEDPYIRATHQIQNLVRFSKAVIKTPTVKKIRLTTGYDDDTDVKEMSKD